MNVLPEFRLIRPKSVEGDGEVLEESHAAPPSPTGSSEVTLPSTISTFRLVAEATLWSWVMITTVTPSSLSLRNNARISLPVC